MATLTIRNIPEEVKQALREQAARHGVSMEEEARNLLARNAGVKSAATASAEDIVRKYGRRPAEPFDLKKLSDEMWDEGLL